MKHKRGLLPARTVRRLRNSGSNGLALGAKTEVLRMRVSPSQKEAIVADAKALGVSATELLLHLHRVASPTLARRLSR